MTRGAVCREQLLALFELRLLGTQVTLTARRIRKMMWCSRSNEELGQIFDARFGSAPVGRVFLHHRDLYWRLFLPPGEKIEVLDPFLVELADVEINTAQCT